MTPGADRLADQPFSWPVVESQDLHRDDWVVALRRDLIERPGHPGDTHSRLVVEHPGAAFILAVDDQERACLIRQYRHPARKVLVEMPAGIIDQPGEDPQRTAERELREEVQLRAASWRHLLTTNPSAGLTSELHHFYLARGLSFADRGDFELHGEEAEIEVLWAPVDDVVDAVLAGRIGEGPMAIAVLAYDALKRRGDL